MNIEDAQAFVAGFCTHEGRNVFDISDDADAGLDRALAVTLTSAVRELSLKLDTLLLRLRTVPKPAALHPATPWERDAGSGPF